MSKIALHRKGPRPGAKYDEHYPPEPTGDNKYRAHFPDVESWQKAMEWARILEARKCYIRAGKVRWNVENAGIHLVPSIAAPIVEPETDPAFRCIVCKVAKPATDYFRYPRAARGHEATCKACRWEERQAKRRKIK